MTFKAILLFIRKTVTKFARLLTLTVTSKSRCAGSGVQKSTPAELAFFNRSWSRTRSGYFLL